MAPTVGATRPAGSCVGSEESTAAPCAFGGAGTAAWASATTRARPAATPSRVALAPTLSATRGYVFNAHAEQAGKMLGGDFVFFESILEGRYYLPLGSFGVVAVKARAGSIGDFGPANLQVPFYRRYWLGGATSLRGWGRLEVSPLFEGQPIGGHTLVESSTELRAPIWGNLSGVVFMDAGNVWQNAWAFQLGDLRYDVGPGLRYQTPIGPIRVDMGFQLNPIPGLLINGQPETRHYRFHFSIGQAF